MLDYSELEHRTPSHNYADADIDQLDLHQDSH